MRAPYTTILGGPIVSRNPIGSVEVEATKTLLSVTLYSSLVFMQVVEDWKWCRLVALAPFPKSLHSSGSVVEKASLTLDHGWYTKETHEEGHGLEHGLR